MDKISNSWNLQQKTKSKNQVPTKQALTYAYGVFRTMGVYRTQKHKYTYFCSSLLINVFVTFWFPIAFVASYFLEANKNLEYGTLFSSIQVVLNVCGNTVKTCMLFVFMPQLVTAEKIMAKLDERCVSEDEVAFLVKLRKMGNKIMAGYLITYFSYPTSTAISAVLAGHPLFSVYLPGIDWRHSKWEFIVASFIEFVLMAGACFTQAANDGYATVYVCILRAHINILCLRIRKLCSSPDKSLKENFEDLKGCIKCHQNLIQIYDIISPVISATFFVQFAVTAAALSMTLINILIFAPDSKAVVASCIYAFVVLTEIFPLCYYANSLIVDSKELYDEIFHSSWLQQSSRYRQMLIVFIQRSQQAMELKAAKIFPINLNSFISIAKFSFSLYTLIKTMGIKERLGLE